MVILICHLLIYLVLPCDARGTSSTAGKAVAVAASMADEFGVVATSMADEVRAEAEAASIAEEVKVSYIGGLTCPVNI